MSKTLNRNIVSTLVVIAVGVASNFAVRKTSIVSFSMFDLTSLFTYFGVLIGFALTVYTFGLSMVSDIKSKINAHEKFSPEQKTKMYESLVSGFAQIKSDIWLIFYSIVTIIFFAIAKEIPNPFGWEVGKWMLPETINLTLFITTTIAMWDIMQTLFNLAEINLELNKNDKIAGS
ncbi:MAG TPA: hypothetical protein VIH57_13990 [Bacteroidales bacterium]